jgi:hypothetical protein
MVATAGFWWNSSSNRTLEWQNAPQCPSISLRTQATRSPRKLAPDLAAAAGKGGMRQDALLLSFLVRDTTKKPPLAGRRETDREEV